MNRFVDPDSSLDDDDLRLEWKKHGFIDVFGLQQCMKLQSLGYFMMQGDVTCSPASPAASSEKLRFSMVFEDFLYSHLQGFQTLGLNSCSLKIGQISKMFTRLMKY